MKHAALAEAERRILAIGRQRDAGTWTPLSSALSRSMEELDARYHAGGTIIGLPTGLFDLDMMLGGLRDGDLVIVAGRPAMGKTGFVANLAARAALRHGARVAFFSLEMSDVQIADRIACAEASVDAQKHRDGDLDDEEF